ncbi:hypothetical protein Taro_013746 [Colocasia esculenta]|uniref:SAP domain-containing protein n=1 Tax=Colocasia esculenta TaxID=4460 RepID=A0A843UCW7_COLES|nr:hypothetical protein [Colocasia esculenta]
MGEFDGRWELKQVVWRNVQIHIITPPGTCPSKIRVQDVAELLGMMVEDNKRIQPNVKTYALLVECFTKYCVVREAIRHFRALKNFEGGTKVLYNEGNFGDPLSLYLRALCREGRPVELLEALEAMAMDNQTMPPRAMILSRKYRTLVSSWIEPLQEEADVGFEIDYIARYVAEGGLTGERKRWVPRRGKAPLDPDALGFAYSNPIETSFKQRCVEDWRMHHRKLLKILRNEGPAALGDVSESDFIRIEERLKKIIKGPDQNMLKPKAASKMIVSELKEELEAQGLPTDGTRQVLYQRVQKARRINRSRGRPLWVPPIEEEEEEVDEELDELISRIKWEDGNTEFWKRRFLGEGPNDVHQNLSEAEDVEVPDMLDDADVVEDVAKDPDDEEAEEEEEVEVEQPENQVEVTVKNKEAERSKPLQMIGVQLLKDSEQPSTTSKSQRKDDDDDDWFPEDPHEAFKEMRERRIFDLSDMYTIADAWDWTWERDLKKRPPKKWSQEWEVELAMKILDKETRDGALLCNMYVCAYKLPKINCGVRCKEARFVFALRTGTRRLCPLGWSWTCTHRKTEFTVSSPTMDIHASPLYDEVISLCLDLGEQDAAIAIVADVETTGINVPDQTLDKVLAARQSTEPSIEDT